MMRFWKREARRERAASNSRPRVAAAVAAAHMAQAGVVRAPTSARAGAGALRYFEAVERASTSGPLAKVQRHARRGLAPELVLATARVAQQAGRRPEEVWSEALHQWLAQNETAKAAPPTHTLRRRQIWHEIDGAMAVLRAS